MSAAACNSQTSNRRQHGVSPSKTETHQFMRLNLCQRVAMIEYIEHLERLRLSAKERRDQNPKDYLWAIALQADNTMLRYYIDSRMGVRKALHSLGLERQDKTNVPDRASKADDKHIYDKSINRKQKDGFGTEPRQGKQTAPYNIRETYLPSRVHLPWAKASPCWNHSGFLKLVYLRPDMLSDGHIPTVNHDS